MLKIERKFVEFVEKHLFLLCVLISLLLALYLRKIAVWWNYGAVSSYFDMHEHYTQTVTYHLIVRLLQYLPLMPLHSIKWLAGLADFGVAGLVTYLLGKEANASKRLIFFITCLFSPVLFLRGITWGQIDSLGILLLLIGYTLYAGEGPKGRKYRKWLALLPTACAAALCPWLFFAALLYFWRKEERQSDFWCGLLLLTAGVFALQLVSALLLQVSLKESFFSLVRFLTYHPESGVRYDNAAEWFMQMLVLCGSAASILTMLAAGRRRFPYVWAILIQIITAALYGAYLFREIV